VLNNAGGGNFSVGARTSWYPSVNSFNDRATFDLTFKVPKQYTLISVGKRVKEWQEEDYAASQWTSEIPLAVAGFNYGRFKKKEITDPDTKYQIEGYAVTDMPDGLRNTGIGGMAPARLLDKSRSNRKPISDRRGRRWSFYRWSLTSIRPNAGC
jgi:hypothetical protein